MGDAVRSLLKPLLSALLLGAVIGGGLGCVRLLAADPQMPAGRDRLGEPELIPVAPRLLVGSRAMAADADLLTRQGVTMVLSVDGQPSPASASTTRLHVPIGYDGPDAAQSAQLAQVLERWQAGGVLLVHCHHGRHRGPAVAAMLARWAGDLSADDAAATLKRCGTDPAMTRLWASVNRPRPAAAIDPVPAVAAASPLAAAMRELQDAVDSPRELGAGLVLAKAIEEVDRARVTQPIDAEQWAGLVAAIEAGESPAAIESRCTRCHVGR